MKPGDSIPNHALKEMQEKKDQFQSEFSKIDPFDIISVGRRLQDVELRGEDIPLSTGETIHARDVLAHEQMDAFLRGWMPFSNTPIFKRLWELLKRNEVKQELGEMGADDESIVFLAQREVDLWICYYSLKDFNENLASLPEKVAIEVLRRHPMIDEIAQKVGKITSTSAEGEKQVDFFRDDQTLPDSGGGISLWKPDDSSRQD